MERYRRLSLMEREELSRMLAAGHSFRRIAQAMQRAPSTLREKNGDILDFLSRKLAFAPS